MSLENVQRSETADTTLESTEEDVVLEMRNVTARYDMERGVSRVLDDATIDVRRNEILGVVGESGSGKSMFASGLLDAIPEPGGLTGEIRYHPNSGESVDILDFSKSELKQYRWEEVSMVFQGAMSSFNPTISIKDHFTETLSAHNYDKAEGLKRTRQLLRDVHLDPDRILRSYPHELSGGMKQRALIALSLLLEPEVIVIDEPTAALDLLMQRSIIELLEQLQEQHSLTIVFITHDLPLVAACSDRIAVMYAFQFAEIGRTDQILHRPAHPYTRALLASTPKLDVPVEDMTPISGESPDPVNVPSGCSYHPRCPLADGRCRAADPDYHSIKGEHRVKCFHSEDAAEAIPIAGSNPELSDNGN